MILTNYSVNHEETRRLPISHRLPALATLPVANLEPYPSYTRDMKQSKLMEFRRDWAPSAIGLIAVARHPTMLNKYIVIDGNHRVTIAKEKQDPLEVACHVYDLTHQEQASMYQLLNNMTPQSARDLFRAQLEAGDPGALAVKQQVEDAGYRISLSSTGSHRASNALQCVQALQGMAVQYGPQHIYRVLKFFAQAFGMDSRPRDHALLAVAQLLKAYEGRLREDRLIQVAATVGSSRMHGMADTEHLEHRVSRARGYGTVLVREYNRGLTGRSRLPDWHLAVGTSNLDERSMRKKGERSQRQAVWNDSINESDGRPS